MSTPTLTPRLEQVRALLQLLGGEPFTDLAEILNALGVLDLKVSGALSSLDIVNAFLGRLTDIPDEPGLPFGSTSWPVANYELLAELLAQFNLRTLGLNTFITARSASGSEGVVLEDYLLSLDSTVGLLQVGISQTRQELVTLNANFDAFRADFATLLDCLNCGGSGPPTFTAPACLDGAAEQATGWNDYGVISLGGVSSRVVSPIFPNPQVSTGIVVLEDGTATRRKYKFPSEGLWNIRLGVDLTGITTGLVVKWNGATLTGNNPVNWFTTFAGTTVLSLGINGSAGACDGEFAGSFSSSSAFEPGDSPIEYFFTFPPTEEPFEAGRVFMALGGVG